MNRFLVAASAAALLLTPLAASAQSHGGGHSGASHWSGGGAHWSGGSGHGGSGHGGWGGYRGYRGYRGGYGGGYFVGGLGLGLALGAYPWYYYGGPGDYGYYGPAYYSYPAWGDDNIPPPPQTGGPPASGQSGQACGAWSWKPDQNRYVWVQGACGAPAAAPPGNAP